MNKEDSFYMDTLEKTQPETFDFINHLSEQCHSELSFASHEINNQLSFIRSSYQLISKKHPETKDFPFWAELGDAVIRFREFPVAAGVLLVPHVPPQRGHERPDPLPQLVDPAGDIRPLVVAMLLDQIEVPLLQIIDPQVPQGGGGSVIIVRLLVLRGYGGYLGLFHGILT